MQEIKDSAEALRFLLVVGLAEVSEAIAWADAQIALSDIPSPELIDVSLSGSKPVAELVRSLSAIPGTPHPEKVASEVLHRLSAFVERNPSNARRAARILYDMYCEGLVPSPDVKEQMLRLDDAFSLAESGTWGTLEEARAELNEFLAEWAQK